MASEILGCTAKQLLSHFQKAVLIDVSPFFKNVFPLTFHGLQDRTVSAHSKRAHEASTRAPSRAGHVAAPEVARRKTPNLGRVEKVYLHWVARDRAAAAWFEQHLADLLPSESTEKRVRVILAANQNFYGDTNQLLFSFSCWKGMK